MRGPHFDSRCSVWNGGMRSDRLHGEGTLTVVHEDDAEHFRIVGKIPTQNSARTMAIDPSTHHIYLPAAEFAPRPEPTAVQPQAPTFVNR